MRTGWMVGALSLAILSCGSYGFGAEPTAPDIEETDALLRAKQLKEQQMTKEGNQKTGKEETGQENGPNPIEEWEKEIMKKLSRRVSFEFVDTPFVEARSFMQSLANINITVDPEAVEEGLDQKTVTLRVTDMDMGTAFKWICRSVGLRYELRDQAIFVTFAEGHQKQEADNGLAVYHLEEGLPKGLTEEKIKVLSAVAAPKARVAYDFDLKLLVVACDEVKDLRRVEVVLKSLGIDTKSKATPEKPIKEE